MKPLLLGLVSPGVLWLLMATANARSEKHIVLQGSSTLPTRKPDLPAKGSRCPPEEDMTYQGMWNKSIYNSVSTTLQVGLWTQLSKTHFELFKVAFSDVDLPNSSFQILKRRKIELSDHHSDDQIQLQPEDTPLSPQPVKVVRPLAQGLILAQDCAYTCT